MIIKESTAMALMHAMGATYVAGLVNEGLTENEIKTEDVERVAREGFEQFCQYCGIDKVREGE